MIHIRWIGNFCKPSPGESKVFKVTVTDSLYLEKNVGLSTV